jgi:hypothetical protein
MKFSPTTQLNLEAPSHHTKTTHREGNSLSPGDFGLNSAASMALSYLLTTTSSFFSGPYFLLPGLKRW